MVELVKAIINACIGIYDKNQETIISEYKQIDNALGALTENEQNKLCDILEANLEKQDSIFVYSCLFRNIPNNKIILKRITEVIIEYDCNPFIGTMLELNMLRFYKDMDRESKKILHNMNKEKFYELYKNDLKFTHIDERNKNRILICTEQLINYNHMPTRIVLEMAKTFAIDFGYEIFIIAIPSDIILPIDLFYDSLVDRNSIEDGQVMKYDISEDKYILIYSTSIKKEYKRKEQYTSIFEIEKKFNPSFVLTIGGGNAVMDLFRYCNTLAILDVSTGVPVNDAQILFKMRYEKNEGMDRIDDSKQVIKTLKDVVPVTIPGELKKAKHRNDEKFTILIVGTRLATEIDDEFARLMKEILNIDDSIIIHIVGGWDKYDLFFDVNLRNRFIIDGFCANLPEISYESDLFLNTKRLGGGISSLTALKEGTPVITLPECDVASNVGDAFISNSYDETLELIKRYFYDDEFYYKKSLAAINRINEVENIDMKDYALEILNFIQETMENRKDICDHAFI